DLAAHLVQLAGPDRRRHVARLLPVPASVLELDRREALLAGVLDHRRTLAEPVLGHALVLDAHVDQRLLDLPAGMRALDPLLLAPMQLDRHRLLLIVAAPTIRACVPSSSASRSARGLRFCWRRLPRRPAPPAG